MYDLIFFCFRIFFFKFNEILVLILAKVKVLVCNVQDRLQLSDDESEHITDHIVGTHIDDLVQIYNGQITVRGSVDMSNIFISSTEKEAPTSQITINGRPFDLPNLNHLYWMKKVNQVGFIF